MPDKSPVENPATDDEEIVDLLEVVTLGKAAPQKSEDPDTVDFSQHIDSMMEELAKHEGADAKEEEDQPFPDPTPVDHEVDPNEELPMPTMEDLDNLLESLGANVEEEKEAPSAKKDVLSQGDDLDLNIPEMEPAPVEAPAESAPVEVTTEPAPVEPAPAEVATEPAPVEPTPTEVATEPAPLEPAPAEVATEPAPVEPAPTEVATEPAPVEPTPTEVATEPAPVEPAPAEVATEPAPVEPAPAEVATEPAPVEPAPAEVATEPAPVEPAAAEVATEPTPVEPASIEIPVAPTRSRQEIPLDTQGLDLGSTVTPTPPETATKNSVAEDPSAEMASNVTSIESPIEAVSTPSASEAQDIKQGELVLNGEEVDLNELDALIDDVLSIAPPSGDSVKKESTVATESSLTSETSPLDAGEQHNEAVSTSLEQLQDAVAHLTSVVNSQANEIQKLQLMLDENLDKKVAAAAAKVIREEILALLPSDE